ncbi:hypothetical protein J3Q09_17915 [Pseudomonas sp. R4-83]|uniref:hypothetical protein n=1 Tax=unclassified Pseudomonas TaxID=196821 RepID=UPI003DAA4E07
MADPGVQPGPPCRERFAARQGAPLGTIVTRVTRRIESSAKEKSQIAGKKNPKQLMEAWDLKMHKPWW